MPADMGMADAIATGALVDGAGTIMPADLVGCALVLRCWSARASRTPRSRAFEERNDA